MSGQFINSGNNPFGKVTLTNNFNTGNLDFSIAPPAYTIGQAALGGIIAYTNGAGTSGFVVTSTDVSTSAIWGCVGIVISSAEGTAIGTGAANTAAIVANCATAGIAARLCDNLVSGGYSDWYLPSTDELYAIYTNRTAIGGISTSYYWTSTQQPGDDYYATQQSFSTGAQVPGRKDTSARVRAIRSF